MLNNINPADRASIEAIRNARTVRIVINEGEDDEQQFTFCESRGDMTAFRRNLRLSVQDYVRACHEKMRRDMWNTWMRGTRP